MGKSGIYELRCDDCSAVYIGQTGRKFKERMKEHEASFRKENCISLFAKHLVEKKHGSNFGEGGRGSGLTRKIK
jgi:hypothetical protein